MSFLPIAAILFAALFTNIARAEVSAPTAFDRFMQQSTGVGKQTVNFGKDGTPVASPGVPKISTDGSDTPKVTNTGRINNPSGNPIDVAVKRKIAGPAVARAVGKAMLKVAPGVSTAIAIKELAAELGFDWQKNADGAIAVKKAAQVCPDGSSTSCVEYFTVYRGTESATGSAFATPKQSCDAWVIQLNRPEPLTVSNTETYCSVIRTEDGYDFSVNIRKRTKEGVTTVPGFVPSSSQEVLDAIAVRSGWPAPSKLKDVLASPEATAEEKIPTQAESISGPATSPGTQRVTQNTTNNTTKTEITTHNHTYEGATVTTTTVTAINITNNTTGDTITQETISDTPAPAPEPIETCGLPGKPACAIDETGVPEQADIDTAMSKTKVQDITKDLNDMIADPAAKLPTLPTINWAFTLPTGCAVLDLPAFAPFITGIDVCQFQPMFHDLMSIVWTLGGLFGAISLFMKNALSH